ncbi:MAG: metallophosphoesterase, partial [Chloroflexia bacterium]
ACLAFQGIVSIGVVYAFYIAPFDLRVTHVEVALPGLARPVRVAQVSDLHLERTTRREAALLAALERERADLIVLTGDYLNLAFQDDPRAVQEARALLGQLRAPLGVYAVAGNVDTPEDLRALFSGLPIELLEDRVREVPPLYLVGVSDRGRARDGEVLRRLMSAVPEGVPAVLLYHNPDLIEVAAEEGVVLYLAGHTHGGQVRLPIYGAFVTLSAYGKRFEAGLYRVGPTALYVSRGIGMEGFWFTPRVRLFCPPELVVLDLVPAVVQ